jgi:hypothetical protein
MEDKCRRLQEEAMREKDRARGQLEERVKELEGVKRENRR